MADLEFGIIIGNEPCIPGFTVQLLCIVRGFLGTCRLRKSFKQWPSQVYPLLFRASSGCMDNNQPHCKLELSVELPGPEGFAVPLEGVGADDDDEY